MQYCLCSINTRDFTLPGPQYFWTYSPTRLLKVLYAGLPVGRLRCLDRALCSAARLSGHIPKFGHVSSYILDVIHSLGHLQQRILYRIIASVWWSLLGLVPSCLVYYQECDRGRESKLVQNSVRYFMDGPLLRDITVGCITVGVQNNSEAKLCLNWRSIIQAMVHLM